MPTALYHWVRKRRCPVGQMWTRRKRVFVSSVAPLIHIFRKNDAGRLIVLFQDSCNVWGFMLPCFRQLTAKVRRSTAKPMPFLSYRSGKGGTMSETTSSRNINWEYRNGPRLGN